MDTLRQPSLDGGLLNTLPYPTSICLFPMFDIAGSIR